MAEVASVIKYEGNNDVFIWKHPQEDFNSLTQLIVHESQEAIFFKDGKALATYDPGRYTLETQNIFGISSGIRKTTGGENPFHCEIYFINQTVQMGLKWGTDRYIRFVDPIYGIPLEIGASGELNLKVLSSQKLLVKLVGTMKNLAWNIEGDDFAQSLKNSFRGLISTIVKSNLAKAIVEEKIDVLELDQNLDKLSNILRNALVEGFEEYGLTIPQFFVRNIVFSENDNQIEKIKELRATQFNIKAEQARRQVEIEGQITETEEYKYHIEREMLRAEADAKRKRLDGLAEAEVMRAKGYTRKDELDRDVQMAYAESLGEVGSNVGSGGLGGSGGVVGDFMNLGVGMAAAGVIGSQMNEMFKGINPSKMQNEEKSVTKTCSKCGTPLFEGSKFCSKCGAIVGGNEDLIVCPACGERIPEGKFCIKCGKALSWVCPSCGKENSSQAQFCPSCGHKN